LWDRHAMDRLQCTLCHRLPSYASTVSPSHVEEGRVPVRVHATPGCVSGQHAAGTGESKPNMDPCRQRGRIFVALRFIESLRRALPSASFLLTTTTSTGHRVAAERLDRRDLLLYFPTDFPWVVRRALRTLRPQALILTESELWPNLIRMAKRSGVPVMLVNGRISQSS